MPMKLAAKQLNRVKPAKQFAMNEYFTKLAASGGSLRYSSAEWKQLRGAASTTSPRRPMRPRRSRP